MQTKQHTASLRGALILCGFVWGVEALYADPCAPTARLSGEPALLEEVSAALSARGISQQSTNGCPAIEATLSRDQEQIKIVMSDASGRSETFLVVGSATAASLLEAWARVSVDPILPPGLEEISLSAEPAEQPTKPDIQPAPKRRGDLGVQMEIVSGGKHTGRGLDASYRLPGFGLWRVALLARGHQISTEYPQILSKLSGSANAPLPVQTVFLGLDGVVSLGRSLERGRWSLTPSMEVGVGVHSARDTIKVIDLNGGPSLRGLLGAQLAVEYRIHEQLKAGISYSWNVTSPEATVDLGWRDADISLLSVAALPNSYARYGLGLSYHF